MITIPAFNKNRTGLIVTTCITALLRPYGAGAYGVITASVTGNGIGISSSASVDNNHTFNLCVRASAALCI
ncbi:hypothetical protein, partial [Chelonobacter oris]|uniref:hypothetical protein n=1 Tax=Chelonobacter oris TaxID=505317 RepID=UPI00244B9E7F